MNWMIFYAQGVSPEHFFYSGDYPPVNVTPQPQKKVMWAGDWQHLDEVELDEEKEILNEVLNSSRKKVFLIRKHRYTVLARGKFIDE
jgi:hypothetical protein